MAMTIEHSAGFGAAGTVANTMASAPTTTERVYWILEFVQRTLKEIRTGQRITAARAHQLFAQATDATGVRF